MDRLMMLADAAVWAVSLIWLTGEILAGVRIIARRLAAGGRR